MTPRDEALRIAANVVPFPEVDRAALPAQQSEGYNALLFVAQHGADVRFCFARNEWFHWNGRFWEPDASGAATALAAGVTRRMLDVVVAMPESERKVWIRHALASHTARSARNILELARPAVAVRPEQLDADRTLLNVANGTLDLRTGTLRPHDRADLITRCLEVAYEPDAPCTTWLGFLSRIFAEDAELVAFMQRALGYSMTGITNEHAIFICHGTGANGKTTLFGVLRALLGEYGTELKSENLLATRMAGSEKTYATAALVGKRLATAAETGDGRRLDEGFVKHATGGDRLAARFPYGRVFDFTPEHKVWLATNHRPGVRGTDDGIWRRLRLVPFEVTIPEPERDRELPEKLLAEAPGILAWLVAGAREWFAHGLGHCGKVDDATAAYRSESDMVLQFVGECCHRLEHTATPAGRLFEAFEGWCRREGIRHYPTGASFGRRLGELGFPSKRAAGGNLRLGIVLDDASPGGAP